jgi:hypothetical protein
LLTVADNNIISLIKSYFSLYELRNKNNYEDLWGMNRYKKPSFDTLTKKWSSLSKIFVAKGSIKHTSSSAIITFYFYNLEKIALLDLFKYTKEERDGYKLLIDQYLNYS